MGTIFSLLMKWGFKFKKISQAISEDRKTSDKMGYYIGIEFEHYHIIGRKRQQLRDKE